MIKNCYRVFFSVVFFMTVHMNGQEKMIWSQMPDALLSSDLRKERLPKNFDVFQIDLPTLKRDLREKPFNTPFKIQIPDTKGKMAIFEVHENEVMDPVLREKFPDNKSYQGHLLSNPKTKIRLTINDLGLHAMIIGEERDIQYIDPFATDRNKYLSYKRKDMDAEGIGFTCLTEDSEVQNKGSFLSKTINDKRLRTFRLALACTGEYAKYHIDRASLQNGTDLQKKALVLSEMVTAINRINEVYENDLAISFQIIGNNDKIIYLDGATDPYTNNDGSTLINENQTNIDNVIGTANYDIGHVFSTGGGGLAALGSTCSTSKAKGVTGTSNPVGDFYYFDFVAHELGHQLGANHSFNGDAGGCGGNRNNATAVEPGSGSTIMAYAGLCAPQNVQGATDLYFHIVSINEIWNFLQIGVGSTCGNKIALTRNLNVPSANAGTDFTIPKSTAYVLKGTGSDSDNDPITFTWEQMDNQVPVTVPPSDKSITGALYRSVKPTGTPKRYMPQLETVVGGALSSTWEVTPSVARSMNFLMTVRDNNAEAGQLATDNVTVTVTDLAGPFKVTSQNLVNTVWEKNSTQTVTWDVAGTNANGINTSAVNILLSTDGGKNFNTVLKSNTPNDGSETVVVPQTGATKCFVMVEAANNIYYAVNAKSFSIGNFVETCTDYVSADIPKNIPDNNLSGVTSGLTISDNINIESVSVSVRINHPFAADLTLFLTNPQGKTVKLLQNECFNLGGNIDAVFSDTGTELICGSSNLVISGNIKPEESLSVFNGGNSLGTWQLKVVDNGAADVGTIESWGIKICSSKEVVGIEDSSLTDFVLYPNPANTYFTVEFTSDEPGDVGISLYDLLGRQILYKNYPNTRLKFKESIVLTSINKGIYLLRVTNGKAISSQKLVVD